MTRNIGDVAPASLQLRLDEELVDDKGRSFAQSIVEPVANGTLP